MSGLAMTRRKAIEAVVACGLVWLLLDLVSRHVGRPYAWTLGLILLCVIAALLVTRR